MPKSMIINDIEFKCQYECMNYVRSMIRRLMHKSITIDSHFKEFTFICRLFQRNPKFKPNGIECFKIESSTGRSRKALQITTCYTSKWTCTHSWRDAIKGKTSSKSNITKAMRQAVNEDIQSYKKKHASQTRCSSCYKRVNQFKFHVDHCAPEFKDMKETFLRTNIITIPTKFDWIETNPNQRRISFLSRDWAFESAWKSYHKEHCVLQMVCEKCNIKTLKQKRKLYQNTEQYH